MRRRRRRLSLAALAHHRDAVAPLDRLLTTGSGDENDRRGRRLGAGERSGAVAVVANSPVPVSTNPLVSVDASISAGGAPRSGGGASGSAAGVAPPQEASAALARSGTSTGRRRLRGIVPSWTTAPLRWFRLPRATLCSQAGWPRAAWRSEESPDTEGQGRWGNPRRRKPTESGTESRPPAGASPEAPAGKGETVGKSPPASWRHGGSPNPARCKANRLRSQVARRGAG